MEDLTGKTAVVTGGASGIGLGIAQALAGAGMRVAIADVEDAALERALASLESAGGEVVAVRVDVTDRSALAAAADQVEDAFGKVHVLCNNAGVLVGGSIDEMTYADWDWVLAVNVRGVINGLQTFLPRIAAHGEGGHIVNTASLAGMSTARGMSVYTASKFAVVGLTEALRADLADSGIGVSVLCPGVVDTNIFDSGRNRPDAMRSETETDVFPLVRHLPEGDRAARMERVLSSALDPAAVGDIVLHGIRRNEKFIFTHPNIEFMVESRHADMVDSFERWRQFRERQGI